MNLLQRSLLVVYNLHDEDDALLTSAFFFAKLYGCGIDLVIPFKPYEYLEKSKTSAHWKPFEKEIARIKKKGESIIEKAFQQNQIPVIYSLKIGNPSLELKKHIEESKPDIVLLHKNKKIFRYKDPFHLPEYLSSYNGTIIKTGKINPNKNVNALRLGTISEKKASTASYQIDLNIKPYSDKILDFNEIPAKKTLSFLVTNEAPDLTPYVSNAKLDLIGLTMDNKKSPSVVQHIKEVFLKKTHLPLVIQKKSCFLRSIFFSLKSSLV